MTLNLSRVICTEATQGYYDLAVVFGHVSINDAFFANGLPVNSQPCGRVKHPSLDLVLNSIAQLLGVLEMF